MQLLNSEMNEINKNSRLDICRVCLERASKLYPLEGPILNVDVYVSTMISYCTSIEVIIDEINLPTGVCVPCFKTIRIAYNFIKQFKETNEKLLVERGNNSKCEDGLQQECDNFVDMPEFKEEPLEMEESDELITNDLLEPSSHQNYFGTEEEIIIKYDNNKSSSDHEPTSTEILPENNDEEIRGEATDIAVIKEDSDDLSSQHEFSKRHECPLCCKIFHDFKRGLMRHVVRSHLDDSVKCNKCSLEAELSVPQYIDHYTKSHLYQCPICNKKLGSKSSFYYHSKGHVDGSSFDCKCQICGKSFLTTLSLRKHMEIHSKDAKYICSKCGKKFNTYDTFRYHNKTHDGKRSHLCNVCGRTFLQSVHLKDHMWHHTGVKQFQCADCVKSYTSVTQLKKHRRKYCGSVKANDK